MTAALGTAAGIVGIIAMSSVHLLIQRERLLQEFDPVTYLRMWLTVPGSFGWLVAACAGLLLTFRRARPGVAVVAGLACCFLVVQTAAVVIPSMRSYRYRFLAEDVRNLDFVETQLARLKTRNTPLTIYMDWGSAGDAWMQFRTNSYFHLAQVVGVLFSRQTAIEATRRAAIVAPFEAKRYAEAAEFEPRIVRLMAQRLFGPTVGERSVGALRQLCADGAIDFAVLKNSTLPAEVITNGQIKIYDCRQLRSGLP